MIFIGSINESNVVEETVKRTERIMIYLYPIIYIWYITDIVVLLLNLYTDGSGISLLPIFG